jgi:hypothetical protein
MSAVPDASSSATFQRRVWGLRGASFGAMTMLVLQFGIGMWVNLFVTLPRSDRGTGFFAAMGTALTGGPLGLTLHVLLGLALLVTGLGAIVRAALLRQTAWIVVTVVAFVALLIAVLLGARFVGSGANEASFGMALGEAVALLCYALVLFRATP